MLVFLLVFGGSGSLSSWRAWIEIDLIIRETWNYAVALLMESVD